MESQRGGGEIHPLGTTTGTLDDNESEARANGLCEIENLPGGGDLWKDIPKAAKELIPAEETDWKPTMEHWSWKWERENGSWKCKLHSERRAVKITPPTEPIRHLGLWQPILNDGGEAQKEKLIPFLIGSKMRGVMSRTPPSATVYVQNAVSKAKVAYPRKFCSPTDEMMWDLHNIVKVAVCNKRSIATTTRNEVITGHVDMGGLGWHEWTCTVNGQKAMELLTALIDGTEVDKALM